MKFGTYVAMLGLVFLVASTFSSAQEVKGFRADLVGQLEYAQKQILDLEQAIPDAKMAWRPNKDVRSIREVYAHIAFGNYLIAKFAGMKVPEGVAVTSPEDGAKWEKTYTDKKAIREQLVKSFDFLKGELRALPDAKLEDAVTFFGQQMTVRGVLMVLFGHIHEHLGQSIAYARSVGVVPPWTAAEQAAQKKK